MVENCTSSCKAEARIPAWCQRLEAALPSTRLRVDTRDSFERGVIAFSGGEMDEARTRFDEVAAVCPDDPQVHYYLNRITTLSADPPSFEEDRYEYLASK